MSRLKPLLLAIALTMSLLTGCAVKSASSVVVPGCPAAPAGLSDEVRTMLDLGMFPATTEYMRRIYRHCQMIEAARGNDE